MVDIETGQTFQSLGNRIIYAFKSTFPEFLEVEDENANTESQRQMHSFLRDSVDTIYETPEIINISHEPDGCYENWMLNRHIPELILSMEKIEKKFFDFYEYLFKLGNYGDVKGKEMHIAKSSVNITKATIRKLEKFGLKITKTETYTVLACPEYPLIFPAWKYLYCTIVKGNMKRTQQLTMFLHGRYKDKLYRTNHMFGKMIENIEEISLFEEYLFLNGFRPINDELSVLWQKNHGTGSKSHMRVSFSWRNKYQLSFSFGVPKFRILFNGYSTLDEDLRKLIFERTKACDDCGYCTQTDKTGTKKKFAAELHYNGLSSVKCPFFPNLNFTMLDAGTIYTIKKLFALSESVL